MNWIRFARRRKADAEQAQELRDYLEIATEENVARGMDPAAARDRKSVV